MQILEKRLLGLVLTVLIAACQPAPLPVTPTATPTQTPTATATLIPLIRPTPSITPTPVLNLGIDLPIAVQSFIYNFTLKITSAQELMQWSPSTLIQTYVIKPKPGYKLLVLSVEIPAEEGALLGCNAMFNSLIIRDENGELYACESDSPQHCRFVVCGVDIASQSFTLLVPTNAPASSSTKRYEVNLDGILVPLVE